MKHYVPELDYYFRQYWESQGDVTIIHVSIPEVVENLFVNPLIYPPEPLYSPDNVFSLLFSSTYDSTGYRYLFRKETNMISYPKKIYERLLVKTSRPAYYLATHDDTTGVNVFNFTQEEFWLLDRLQEYRTMQMTNIDDIDYSGLQSNLSKLIYIYLDTFINNQYETLLLLGDIPDEGRICDVLFKLYVINECHKKLRYDAIMLPLEVLELVPKRRKILVTETVLTQKKFTITPPLPESLDDFYIYLNGRVLPNSMYQTEFYPEENPETLTVSFPDLSSLKENDMFIAEFYARNRKYSDIKDPTSVIMSSDYSLQEYIVEHIPEYKSIEDIPLPGQEPRLEYRLPEGEGEQ